MVDVASSNVPVVWKIERSEVDRLLGKTGRILLDDVIRLMQHAAIDHMWPLKQIDICYWLDVEETDSEILRTVLVFEAHPDRAEQYWKSFLGLSDSFQKGLSKARRKMYIERFGIGFEAV